MKLNKGKGAGRVGMETAFADRTYEADGMKPQLDRATQVRIGDQLRAMYMDLLDQPVPDRFRDLLGQLEGVGDKAVEGASGGAGQTTGQGDREIER